MRVIRSGRSSSCWWGLVWWKRVACLLLVVGFIAIHLVYRDESVGGGKKGVLYGNGVIPKIVYGTAWKKDETSTYVVAALKKGFRGLDTACQPKHYNEGGVGDAIVDAGIPRSSLFLQTKFTPASGQDLDTIPYDPSAPLVQQVEQSVAVSLKNLKTDYIDSYLLHSPLQTVEESVAVWRRLEEYVKEGTLKNLGISNIYDITYLKQFYEEVTIKPAIIQNRFHANTQWCRTIRQFCKEHGIVFQSFWTLTGNRDIVGGEVVREIAERRGKTPEAVFLRFVMEQDIVPLTGTKSSVHMEEDLDVLNFGLTKEEVDTIASLIGE